MNLSCVVAGSPGVGKTSIVKRCLKDYNKSYPTIGYEVHDKAMVLCEPPVNLCIVDMSGYLDVTLAPSSITTNIDILILVYDVTDRESFESVDVWRDALTPAAQVFVVANKIDLPRAVTQLEGLKKAETLFALYEETSAKNDEGIEDLFRIACKHVVKERKESTDVDSRRRKCECKIL